MPALNSGHTVGYVRHPTLIRCVRIELPLEPVGCHDTGFAFTCSWATVPNLSFYSGTLHQPPDPVHSALLSGITQIEIDLAITIDAARLKPELFDLPGQHLICLVTLRMWLLKPEIESTRMDIQNPTEQTNRPATAVVADKGVPQSDSFAKYAAAFFNMSRSSVTRFNSF